MHISFLDLSLEGSRIESQSCIRLHERFPERLWRESPLKLLASSPTKTISKGPMVCPTSIMTFRSAALRRRPARTTPGTPITRTINRPAIIPNRTGGRKPKPADGTTKPRGELFAQQGQKKKPAGWADGLQWTGSGLNRRPRHFQCRALPAELPVQVQQF